MSIEDRTDQELKDEKDRILCLDSQRDLHPPEEERLQAVVAEQKRRLEKGVGDD